MRIILLSINQPHCPLLLLRLWYMSYDEDGGGLEGEKRGRRGQCRRWK